MKRATHLVVEEFEIGRRDAGDRHRRRSREVPEIGGEAQHVLQLTLLQTPDHHREANDHAVGQSLARTELDTVERGLRARTQVSAQEPFIVIIILIIIIIIIITLPILPLLNK
jgi:hypothetical protein